MSPERIEDRDGCEQPFERDDTKDSKKPAPIKKPANAGFELAVLSCFRGNLKGTQGVARSKTLMMCSASSSSCKHLNYGASLLRRDLISSCQCLCWVVPWNKGRRGSSCVSNQCGCAVWWGCHCPGCCHSPVGKGDSLTTYRRRPSRH